MPAVFAQLCCFKLPLSRITSSSQRGKTDKLSCHQSNPGDYALCLRWSWDISGQSDFGKFSLTNLVNMTGACGHFRATILDPFAIDSYSTLFDHAERL